MVKTGRKRTKRMVALTTTQKKSLSHLRLPDWAAFNWALVSMAARSAALLASRWPRALPRIPTPLAFSWVIKVGELTRARRGDPLRERSRPVPQRRPPIKGVP